MKKLKPGKINNVWAKTKGICAHCGKRVATRSRTIDHFVPKFQGGSYDFRNLMPLCRDCNRLRGSRWIDPFVFYSYAPWKANRQCLDYRKGFLKEHTNMEGEVLIPPRPAWINYPKKKEE